MSQKIVKNRIIFLFYQYILYLCSKFFTMLKKLLLYPSVTLILLITCSICGCERNFDTAQSIEKHPDIFPDYRDVAIPVNIAPLNFVLQDSCQRVEVHFIHNDRILLKSKGRNRIDISLRAWRGMLQTAASSDLKVLVYAKNAGQWKAYKPFGIHVAPDSIDSYIAYRLIDPGYEIWDRMGIYQRNLSNFDESPIIINRLNEKNCMNCHSFHNYNPDRMMFHSRQTSVGTFLYADGVPQRVNTRTESALSTGTYPIWHPSGDYIAFSANVTQQTFHALPGKKIEVYDMESDLMILDIKNNTMLLDKRFTTKNEWETYPAWSPDGKWLYYCCADEKNMPFESEQLMYGLYRVGFNAATGRFEAQIDTILNPELTGKSISFPRISPDGRFLMYTSSDYATFPIWHTEADLEMLDLNSNMPVDIQAINSDDAESYHSWSSNGRWIVFSSRRIDGLYTRAFFAYFDASGKMHKPFLLPQKNPIENYRRLKSYNIPEFIKGKVTLNPYEISRVLNGEIINLNEIIVQND